MPSKRGSVADVLARLDSHKAGSPELQNYAIGLLRSDKRLSLVGPAAQALVGTTREEARGPLVDWLERLGEDGGRRDSGASARIAILRALQRLLLPEDARILGRACLTYEYAPPGRMEVAAMLRATALTTLDVLDSALAAQYAARLLFDQHVEEMSGEPALTAARVLASRHQTIPLLAYLHRTSRVSSEVVAECLRAQTALPLPLVHELIARFGPDDDADTDEMVESALVDLLVSHEERQSLLDDLFQLLWNTKSTLVLRYGATVLAAARDDGLHQLLLDLAEQEEEPARLGAMIDAVQLLPEDDDSKKILERMYDSLASAEG